MSKIYVPNRKDDEVIIFAGPCSVESQDQFDAVASVLAELGLTWVRGGAFKPRTSPYSFQGLGLEGVKIMQDAGKRYGLKTITEVVDTTHVVEVLEHVDAIQIGTRNMANFELLKVIGQATQQLHQPVLFKRGMAATIDEWLAAVEYITQFGNPNVMLCERGIRTFENATRFTLDIAAVPVVHQRSMYPICVDVSHPAGQTALIGDLAKASIAAGADALMIEVHPDPKKAKSDAAQQLTIPQFATLLEELRGVAAAVGKRIV